jgi:hypothetical protein
MVAKWCHEPLRRGESGGRLGGIFDKCNDASKVCAGVSLSFGGGRENPVANATCGIGVGDRKLKSNKGLACAWVIDRWFHVESIWR